MSTSANERMWTCQVATNAWAYLPVCRVGAPNVGFKKKNWSLPSLNQNPSLSSKMPTDWASLCAANTSFCCGEQRHAVFRQCIPLWWKWRRRHSTSLLWSCLSDSSQTWSWEQLSSPMAADHHVVWLPIMCYVSHAFRMHAENCPLGYYPLAPPLVIVWGQSTARPAYSFVYFDSSMLISWDIERFTSHFRSRRNQGNASVQRWSGAVELTPAL